MITVDVEAQPARSDKDHINRLIYGRFGHEEYGIGKMFDIAEKYNARLTSFLDYAEQHLYGEDLLDVGRYICSRGQDLQVHLHPEFIPPIVFKKNNIKQKFDLFSASPEQSAFFVDHVVQAHSGITANPPVAFRGGGYRYNGCILTELAKHGFAFNSCYIPAYANQPFNIGPLKQFQWTENIIELPVSCVPNFKNTTKLYEYNFNGGLLFGKTVNDCVQSHDLYLETFFQKFGEDAVAVLVMHSWSFLKLNKESGFFDDIRQEAVERFSALLEMFSTKYEIVAADELAQQHDLCIDRVQEWERNNFILENKEKDGIVCDICGESINNFRDYNGEKRQCGACGSVERQRTFAQLLQSGKFSHDLSGKRILLIAPSRCERRIFESISNAQITTLALREEERVDIVADMCRMPQVAGKSFDVIFASHVLVHVYGLQAALGELARILADGGIFISYEPISAGKVTVQNSDIEKITRHYGKEAYEKYKLGRFRDFGDLDLDSIFALYFERSAYHLEDRATSLPATWNIWKKIDLRRQVTALAVTAVFSPSAGGKMADSMRQLGKEEWLFFKNHCVSPGEQVELHGYLTSLERRTVAVTDIRNNVVAHLELSGRTAGFVMRRLAANSTTEGGSPAPLAAVRIPEYLRPGIYFLDGEWLFIVRGTPEKSSVAVVLPVSTMHFFNDAFGGSAYDASYAGVQYLRYSMLRPLRSSLLAGQKISKEFLTHLSDILTTETVAWLPEYELPALTGKSSPRLMIICGRSEYWSKEARDAVGKFIDLGTHILCASAETMYHEITIDFASGVLQRDRRYKFVEKDNNILRNIIGANPYDGGFLPKMAGDRDPGYGKFTIVDAEEAFFQDTGLADHDVFPMASMAYDGIPVREYDERGYPVLNLEGFDRWHDIRLFAFCCGSDSPKQRIGAFALFDAGSGKGRVVHMGSLAWTSRFAFTEGNPAPRILKNVILDLLGNKNNSREVFAQDRPSPLFPYENLTNDPATSELSLRCERIISTGWERDGYVTPLDSIPWQMQPGTPRSFNFRIHCLDMCQDLLLAFSSGGPQKFFDAAARAALEWCGRYSEGKNADDSPHIWYDMSAGMRAYRLAYIYDVLQRNSLGSAEDRALLWKSLLEHRHYLEDDANIAFHSNHGYYQIVGQMAMGRRLAAYDPAMRDLYAQGQRRFAEMMRTQFTEEGIHKENSPDYHRMLLQTLRAILKSNLVDEPGILAFTDRIEHTLSSFVCPDRTILQFGDSDARDIKLSTGPIALAKWSEPAMQYLASGGKVGTAPDDGLLVYPRSGYAVVRRPGKRFPEVFHDQSHLALNAAFHSCTHRHADDLTLTWYDRGQHILVDAGRYGYVGKMAKDSPLRQEGFWYSDPFRIYCESTRAHNTLEFDGRNNPRRRTLLYGSALRRCGERDGVFFMEAELQLFETIHRARTLLFKPASWLLIHDWFHDSQDEPHNVRQWFHTAPHLTMQPDEHGWHCRLAEEGALHVTSLLPDMQPMPVVRGQETPELQGWCSRQVLEKTPNDAFGYEKKDSPNGNFAVLSAFSEVQADRQWSWMNESGREGRFRWQDADGVHHIELKRPAEGDISFSYVIKK